MADFLKNDPIYSAVVEILAVTVLLDMKERDIELIEFTHAGIIHTQFIHAEKIVTRDHLLSWFAANKEEIKRNLTAENSLTYKTELLKRIEDSELQRRVLASIFTISVCDYDLHDEEQDFIKIALDIWKQPMPSPDCLDAVA